MLHKNTLTYLSYFSQKVGFDISCILSPVLGDNLHKCQSLLCRKSKKNITSVSFAESAHGVVKKDKVPFCLIGSKCVRI